MVLNIDCHSVGRVPSSYPRGVRRPTALLWFYPMSFLFFTSVCLGLVRFARFVFVVAVAFVAMSFVLVSLCVTV